MSTARVDGPSDVGEYPIGLDDRCDAAHAKAIVTERSGFVAINPPALAQHD